MRIAAIAFLLLVCIPAFSQEADIAPYISAWKVKDRTQSHRAIVFFDTLDAEKDSVKHNQVLHALYLYISNNPDKRVEARILMYEAFGALVFRRTGEKYRLMLERAMQIAHELKDDQLLAEVYVLYAEIASGQSHPLYNLKAIELQRRIGFEHFHTVHNRFFIVSNALYHSQDYRQSIQYGLECLSFINTDREHWLKRIYILQLDILGAAYKKLHKYDSTVYYYQKILDTLQADPDTGLIHNLWVGIAKGNIGHSLVLQKQYAAAIPLIQEYIRHSLAANYPGNVAMGSAFLADAWYAQGLYAPALQAWQQAYHYSDTANPEQYLLEATKGMADIYRKTGKADSAFYYYDLYRAFEYELDERLDASRLSAINARIDSENLQEHLTQSRAALSRSRSVLQLTIAGSILLLTILLLLYNRYRLKNRHRLELIHRKKELAEAEIANAQKQIAGFMEHIIEKNNLIASLEVQLRGTQEEEQNRLAMEKLSRYMLVSEDEWEKFRNEFSKAYPAFFTRLRQQFPTITPAEERLSALLYLRLNNFQITKMLGIERESVSRARRRLKHRLGLAENETLEDYFHKLMEIK
ncbi:MAG TPA: hypothetical protein PKC69_01895 [Chitinophagaceae bacterium]|nr:hypothetical protein [Chitinophagaceae bacterium]